MSRRGADRLVLGLAVCAVALSPACSGGGDDAVDPAGADAPAEFEAAFEVDAPVAVVAGDGQAWVLREVDGGQSLARIDHTGRSTDVARLPGQSHDMARYRDGVVVVRLACDGDECAESAAKVLVVDGDGSTVDEAEFAREPGSPERSDAVRLHGVTDDVVWLDTFEGLIGYEPETGETRTADRSDPPGRGGARDLGLADLEAYRKPPDLAVAPEAVAVGQEGQVFVLVGDGMVRRVVGPAAAPTSVDVLDVPADIFFQRYGAVPSFSFDTSPTVVAGCIRQPEAHRTGQCYISSP